MNYSNKLLLLMQPTSLQGVATPPILLASSTPSVSRQLIENNMAAAYPELPTHDWGYFGEYEYLGPGTPYTKKMQEGIQPVNEIDRMAQLHDSHYQWSNENFTAPGSGLPKSIFRGVVDYGAGAAMWMEALNPFNDLSAKDRLLGILAGEGLMIQGIVRVSPVGWTVGPMADLILY